MALSVVGRVCVCAKNVGELRWSKSHTLQLANDVLIMKQQPCMARTLPTFLYARAYGC